MKSLPLSWTKGLNGESKSNFEVLLRNSSTVLGRLHSILEEKERELNSSEMSVKSFEDPNWAYKQAFVNGQKSGLKEIRDLLDFIKG